MRPYEPVLGLLLSRGGKVAWSRSYATLSWSVGVQFCSFGGGGGDVSDVSAEVCLGRQLGGWCSVII